MSEEQKFRATLILHRWLLEHFSAHKVLQLTAQDKEKLLTALLTELRS